MTDRGKLVKKIVEGLKTLASVKFDSESELIKVSSTAEDLLFAVYKAGVTNTTYSPEEKQTIGSLISPALQGLGYHVNILQSSFSSNSVDSLRIQRSGLQFLIDSFKDFSDSTKDTTETLGKTFKEFVEHEDIDGFDERFRTVEFDYYTDDYERSETLKAEIAKLPSTHWWFIES